MSKRRGRPGKYDPAKMKLEEQRREEARMREAKKQPTPLEFFYQQGWINNDELRAGEDYQWLCVCRFGNPSAKGASYDEVVKEHHEPSTINLQQWTEATEVLKSIGAAQIISNLCYHEIWPIALLTRKGVAETQAITALRELTRWWLRRGIKRAA